MTDPQGYIPSLKVTGTQKYYHTGDLFQRKTYHLAEMASEPMRAEITEY